MWICCWENIASWILGPSRSPSSTIIPADARASLPPCGGKLNIRSRRTRRRRQGCCLKGSDGRSHVSVQRKDANVGHRASRPFSRRREQTEHAYGRPAKVPQVDLPPSLGARIISHI